MTDTALSPLLWNYRDFILFSDALQIHRNSHHLDRPLRMPTPTGHQAHAPCPSSNCIEKLTMALLPHNPLRHGLRRVSCPAKMERAPAHRREPSHAPLRLPITPARSVPNRVLSRMNELGDHGQD
jgi:hypothetical protein